MSNRAEARVDLAAIAANVKKLKASSNTLLMAVVKADAYGHGLVPVSKAAIAAGADWLGVALVEEAHALRSAGITSPILAWLLPPGSDYAAAIAAEIDLAVPSLDILDEVIATGKRARVHLELDTGMTRGGFLAEWPELLKSDLSKVEIVGIFSHFASADEVNSPQNQSQLSRFNAAVAELAALGIKPQIKHLSNSAATITNPSMGFDLVRTGIAMYGMTPDLEHLGTSKSLGLSAAMELRAKLHLVKKVPANSPVGYGATEYTSRDTVLGVVAMGYADGIPRSAKAAGIFYNGERSPIIGRVSMDQFVVDLGPDSNAKPGEYVVIFNSGDAGEFTAEDWGVASGSINYEITTRIGPRVPRIYMSEVKELLAIAGLTVKFGGLTALDDVHLKVAPNSVVGLIGPNGAGKTTLFNAISGLVTPDAGEISYEERSINWPKPNELAKLAISRTLQGVGLFSGLSVLENVMMGADAHNKSNFVRDLVGLSPKFEKQLEERAHEALAWAGAAHTAFLEPTELTYPDTKRVAIARALVMQPKLLLLDEPAAGLGQDEIDQLAALIKQLRRRCAILIVEHHVDFVSEISDQVYVLNFGKVIASGDFNTVKRDPAVVAAYLGTTTDGQEIGTQNA